MKKVLLLIGLLFFTSPLLAKNWYVLAGKDGEGTIKSPLGTLQDALSMASSGDVIHVAQGYYTGEGGVGKWIIKVPNLTLVGGYSADFKKRDPFIHPTVLMRAMHSFGALEECKKRGHEKIHPMTLTRGEYNVGPILQGETTLYESHENTIIDGFTIDGHTRNLYHPDGSLRLDKGATSAPLIHFSAEGCKVRNSILLNSAGGAVRIAFKGKKDQGNSLAEVSNCLILNVLMYGINCEVGDGWGVVKNNTIAYVWDHLNNGYGLIIGKSVRLKAEGNIFYHIERTGLNNSRLNRYVQVNKNVFWGNKRGAYKFFSPHSNSFLFVRDPQKLTGKKANLRYLLSEKSDSNIQGNPQFKVDSHFVRDLQGKIFAPIYEPLQALFLLNPNQALKEMGVRGSEKFLAYHSVEEKKVKKNYLFIPYKDIKGPLFEQIERAGEKGFPATFDLRLHGQAAPGYYLPGVSRQHYYCFRSHQLLLYVYAKKGSPALRLLVRARKETLTLKVKGTLYNVSSHSKVAYSVALVLDEAEEK